MLERPIQMELGFKFEARSPIQTAAESVTRQWVRDYQSGQTDIEAWTHIANVHPKFAKRINAFYFKAQKAWDSQSSAEFDDPRFEYLESIKLQAKQKSSLSNPYTWETVSTNFALISDLLWMRSPSYYSSGDISEQLDIIFGEITPAAIFDFEETVEHPNIGYPTEEIIARILSQDIHLSPSFQDDSLKN